MQVVRGRHLTYYKDNHHDIQMGRMGQVLALSILEDMRDQPIRLQQVLEVLEKVGVKLVKCLLLTRNGHLMSSHRLQLNKYDDSASHNSKMVSHNICSHIKNLVANGH